MRQHMPAKRTTHKIRNPKTGRMVSRTGAVGRKVLASKKRTAKRKARVASTRKKTTTRRKKTTTRRNKTVKKRQSKGKYSGRGTVRSRSCFKFTKKGDIRLSARAFYNAGGRVGAVHCYGNGCKRLKLRKNGSPYWG